MSDRDVNSLIDRAKKEKISELPVRRFMSRETHAIPTGTKIGYAIKMLLNHKISGAPVIDNNKRVIGFLSEYDLLLQTATKDILSPVHYQHDITTVTPDTTLQAVLVLFYKKKFKRLPVVDEQKQLAGIVTRADVLNRLITF